MSSNPDPITTKQLADLIKAACDEALASNMSPLDLKTRLEEGPLAQVEVPFFFISV